MLTLDCLHRLSDSEVAQLDIAEANLICAEGLPGAESIDVAVCLRVLDGWAEKVRVETERVGYLFRRRPQTFEHSWARFRMMALVTVLQRDIGVRYNPERIEKDDFSNSVDLFLHGITQTRLGTCASLPVCFVAVGRCLHYPLKLVRAKCHLFARWEDSDGERFNIECTTLGFNPRPDEHYYTWPFPTTQEEVEKYGFLRSLTPRQELTTFLTTRGHCWLDNGCYPKAASAYSLAFSLEPEDRLLMGSLIDTRDRWDKALSDQLPIMVPRMRITWSTRRFPAMPELLEMDLLRLEVLQQLWEDHMPQWEQIGTPEHIHVHFDGSVPQLKLEMTRATSTL